MNLKDKVVVITGGTKGLGKALALSFLANGAKVVVCSRESERPFDLEKDIIWIKADIVKENELQNLAEQTINFFGNIDIWINNAGIWMQRDIIENLNMEKVREMFEVNVFGLMNGTKISIRYMKKEKREGTIINIISDIALKKHSELSSSAYMASKYAVDGFTKDIREENKNISIFAVYPGATKTDLFKEKIPENYAEFMNPKEVAEKIIENLKRENPEEELIIKK